MILARRSRSDSAWPDPGLRTWLDGNFWDGRVSDLPSEDRRLARIPDSQGLGGSSHSKELR